MEKGIFFHEKTIKELKKSDKISFILYTDIRDNIIEKDILYNIINYKEIYNKFIDSYMSDLRSSIWSCYSNKNVYFYIVKVMNLLDLEKNKKSIYGLFMNILNLSLNSNINELYTYYHFDKNINESLFFPLMKRISENVSVNICKKEL